jgi:hypothetical protein
VEVAFTNRLAYRHYRLLFPTVRDAGAAVAVQIAEIELLGHTGPAVPEFGALIRSNIETSLFGRNASLFLRFPFTVETEGPRPHLALRVYCDDGFVAFLNGVEIARLNAPAALAFNSAALTNRARAQAILEDRLDLSRFAQWLRPGPNLLAIQGLNDRADSPDFLVTAQLENTEVMLTQTGYFRSPTPGAMNGPASLGWMPEVVADPPRGFYESPIDVTLSCPIGGPPLYYTTNGSAPSATNGQLYSGPLRIERTTVLRAIASRDGWVPSPVMTHTYLFLDDVVAQTRSNTLAAGFPSSWTGTAADYGLDPRVVGPAGKDNYGGKYARTILSDLKSVPTLSLVMGMADLFGSQGIYTNPERRGDAWERPGSLELIYPDGRKGFQQNAGFRIQGGAFRRFDLTLKKSFRVIFRETYGAGMLHYPLFGPEAADRFNNFVLRANSNDGWPYFGASCLYIRDAFAMDTARAMGRAAPHSTFVHLYINGFYWGLYNPVERPDAAFSATYHGGERDSWDAINQDSVPDGNYDAWNRMLALLGQGMSRNDVYQRIQGNNPDGTRNPAYEDLLDVENMIDYMILNFYVGNTDWPHRNWWVGRNRDNGDGFQFYPWDTETALGITGLNLDITGASAAVARPYAAAKANADFRMQFADRVYRHFFNGGALYVNPASPAWDPAHPENNRPAARLAALANQVDRAIVGESARWGDQRNTGPFTRDEHWQPERDNLLANFLPRRSAIVLSQFQRAGLYPLTDTPMMSQRGGQVAEGFELILHAPQGAIYYTTDGSDPRVTGEVGEISRQTLLSSNAAKRVMIPSNLNGGSALGTSWQGNTEPFDDSSWIPGSRAVGFDRETTYASLIGINVRTAMDNLNTSAFIRIPFQFNPTTAGPLNYLALRVQYDDGFVAFLNGVKIASANAPSSLTWNATASASNADSAAVNFEEFRADGGLAALRSGSNVLAIQGLNLSLTSSDFLIGAELVAGNRQAATPSPQSLVYTGPIRLTNLTTIKARALLGQEWSALNEARFIVGQPALALTELHYHPAHPSPAEIAAGFVDADEFEFIELLSNGTATFDLLGVQFVEGIQFVFSSSSLTSLAPGQYAVVVKNRLAFEMRYGKGLPVAGEYAGKLDSAGERIKLVDGQGALLLDFTYGTRPPWPRTPDGQGPSLEVVNPKANLNSPANWRASGITGGSPGAPNPPAQIALQVVGLEGQKLRLRFPGIAGLAYTLYVRDSLSSGSWQIISQGPPLGSDQPVEIDVDIAPNEATRFYRVSIP